MKGERPMKRIKADNRGIALITVVIGVMFCLLLTSTMMRVSLLGLQSREVNNQSSDNFYDAESVVDTVRLNLQHYAAKAWAETTNGTDSENFVKQTYFLLTGTSYPVSGGISLSDTQKNHVIDSLKANAKNGGSILSIGNMETVTGASGKLEGLIIRDVEVKYEHPTTKMVSYVKTDITISAPLYASKKRFPLASYSMFAGSGANLWNAQGFPGQYENPNQFGFLEQKGNVYFGYESWDSAGNVTAVRIQNRETLILSGENVVINGDVILTNYSNLQITGTDVEIRGKVYLGTGCHLIVGPRFLTSLSRPPHLGQGNLGGLSFHPSHHLIKFLQRTATTAHLRQQSCISQPALLPSQRGALPMHLRYHKTFEDGHRF